MTQKPEPEESISRAAVQKLADNLKSSAENVLQLVAQEQIQIEQLLDATRFMARTARRIGKRANWHYDEPAPGNELKPKRLGGSRPREGAGDQRRRPGGGDKRRTGGGGGPRGPRGAGQGGRGGSGGGGFRSSRGGSGGSDRGGDRGGDRRRP